MRFRKSSYLLLFLFVCLFLFGSCDKLKAVTKANNADGADKSANVTHNIEVRHVSFDSDKNGLVIARGDEEPRLIAPASPNSSNITQELLYANGFMIAQQFEQNILSFRLDTSDNKIHDSEFAALLQGFVDYFAGLELKQEYLADLDKRIGTYIQDLQKQKEAFATSYFDTLASDSSVQKTESGLMYKKLEEGSGEEIKFDDAQINVDYTMSVFDNFSQNKKNVVDSNTGIKFDVQNLIPGVIEGVQLMREGDKFEFYIKPELGYGMYGAPPKIPANSYLIFEIKVNKIENPSLSGKDKPAQEQESTPSAESQSDSSKPNTEVK